MCDYCALSSLSTYHSLCSSHTLAHILIRLVIGDLFSARDSVFLRALVERERERDTEGRSWKKSWPRIERGRSPSRAQLHRGDRRDRMSSLAWSRSRERARL